MLENCEAGAKNANSQNQRLIGIIASHVDDFFITGDMQNQTYKAARDKVRSLYKWGKWVVGEFTFAGVHHRQLLSKEIEVDQFDYVNETVEEISIDKKRAMQNCRTTSLIRVH